MSSQKSRGRILVVDDHHEMVELLAAKLGDEGFEVDVATGGRRAVEMVRDGLPDVVVTDLRMEEVDGMDVLEQVHAIDPLVPVIIMTAFGAVDSAIEAMKRGAFHYIPKPFKLDELMVYVERAIEDVHVKSENRTLRRMALDRSSLDEMIGLSEPMQTLRQRIERVCATDVPVLIRGESGTGKELVARALHFMGPRSAEPFVPINCTVLPEELLESELFGHAAGAFTGASGSRKGLFVEADGGTLLLDEIGDMPMKLQAKLLRVLEDSVVRAVGSDKRRHVDVRILAATHQDLEQKVERGEFREDLFYRLNVIPVDVPPLRRRDGDLPLLVSHFVEKARREHPAAAVERFDDDALAMLAAHPWPGNVRQLENVVKRLVILGEQPQVDLDDLGEHTDLEPTPDTFALDASAGPMRSLRELTDDYIDWVVEQCDGNKTRAAEVLDIDPSTIYRREKSRNE